MAKRLKSNGSNLTPITIKVNDQDIECYAGETLASALTNEFGIGYSETKTGKMRGPVCNMGACYDCSAYVDGVGRVRTCMTYAEDGMEVSTQFKPPLLIEQQSPSSLPAMNMPAELKEITPYDVIVVGAGPAGLGAVDELTGNGLRVAVLDEQKKSGGQIYRQPPEEFASTEAGHEFIKNIEESSDVEWIHGSVVWGITPKRIDGKTTAPPEEADLLEVCVEGRPPLLTNYVILATGAYERLLTIPGWDLPGVMSAGGIQIFLKTQNTLPGENIFLTGSHPFLFIVAEKIIKSGGNVTGIALTTSFPQFTEMINFGCKSLRHTHKLKELWSAFRTIRKAKVPILYGHIPTSIEGDQSNKTVTVSPILKNKEIHYNDGKVFQCNIVGMCFGFNASSELARQIGCDMENDFDRGGMIVKHNDVLQSSLSRVFAAGEITGIGGAELSEIEGRLAGLGVMKLGFNVRAHNQQIKKMQKERRKWTTFADMLNTATAIPKSVFSPSSKNPDMYMCRCEQITIKEIVETINQEPDIDSLNAIKLKTRCGMGLCQGRNCESTLKVFIEHEFPEKASNVGEFTTRFPVKPVVIRDLVR